MLIRRIYAPLAAATLFGSVGVFVACSSDSTNPATTTTTPDAGSSTPDAASTDAAVINNTIDGGVPVTSNGVEVLQYDPTLPFTVANVYTASGPVLDARWGNHGGPLVTTTDDVGQQTVTRWTLSGATATATTITPPNPYAPPASTYSSESPIVDLPFDNVAFTYYAPTGSTTAAGEVVLLSPNYTAIIAQAFVNGFSSAVGVTDGTKTRLVYGALSGITSEIASATQQDSAMYVSDITSTPDVSDAGTDDAGDAGDAGDEDASVATTVGFGATATKLFEVTGAIGPVTTDSDGNVFVSTNVAGATAYGITAAQALGTAAVTGATVLTSSTALGTRSIAAASVKGSGTGWVFAKGADPQTGTAQAAPIYGGAYTVSGGAISASGAAIPLAIVASGENTITVFNSPDGHLWAAVNASASSSASTNWFVELAPK